MIVLVMITCAMTCSAAYALGVFLAVLDTRAARKERERQRKGRVA